MKKGFSSKKTEALFDEIVKNNSLSGSQWCELGNRIMEYGKEVQYRKTEQISALMEKNPHIDWATVVLC